MRFTELEKKHGFAFPESFRRIERTGVMEWAECGADEFNRRRQEFYCDPKSFMMIEADCELIMAEDHDHYVGFLDHFSSMSEEYGGLIFNRRYRFVPFGITGGGDIFCFAYDGDSEPFVIKIYHDEDDYQYCGKDFDEFLYVMMLEAAAYSLGYDHEDYRTEEWLKHLDYLADEYRALLENAVFADADAAEAEMNKIIDRERPEIYVKYDKPGKAGESEE